MKWLTSILIAVSFYIFVMAAQAEEKNGYLATVKNYIELYEIPTKKDEKITYKNCKKDGMHSNAQLSEVTGDFHRNFPGSTISCIYGSGIVVQGNFKMFFNNWNVYKVEIDIGHYQHVYSPEQNLIKVTDGVNYIVVEVNKQQPDQSLFTDASLPVLAATADRILGEKSKKNEF